MYKNKLTILIATSIIIAGCDNSVEDISSKVNNYKEEVINVTKIDNDLMNNVNSAIEKEKAELANYLIEMQKTDPTIKDLYYTYSESGEKLLHLIRDPAGAVGDVATEAKEKVQTEVANSSSHLEDFIWGMAGGLTGAMLFNAFSNGGMKSMTNSYQPKSSSMFPKNEYQNRKMLANNNYKNSVFSMNKNKVLANGGRPISNISTNNQSINKNIDTTKKLTPVKSQYHPNVTTQKPKKRFSFSSKKRR